MNNLSDNLRKKMGENVGNKVSEEDILYSLKPLIDEYFAGDCTCDGKEITYVLPGGEKFAINVKKV